MERVLIMFATRQGQTAKVASQLAKELAKVGLATQLVDASDTLAINNVDVESFDLLVFGASMHAGGLEAEIVEFINQNADQISPKTKSFFLVLLSAATKDPDLRKRWLLDARNKLNSQLKVHFADCEMVAGALAYSKYSMPVKWMMKRIAKRAGEATDTSKDYEYTDWDQIHRYAERLTQPKVGE